MSDRFLVKQLVGELKKEEDLQSSIFAGLLHLVLF